MWLLPLCCLHHLWHDRRGSHLWQGMGYSESEVETFVVALQLETFAAALELETNVAPLELETNVAPLELETETDVSYEILKQVQYSAD
jgi:hypothetical protein